MTYVDSILEEVELMTPKTGFNVCIFDDFGDVGEKLTVIGHFDSREEADDLVAEYDDDITLYIYGSEKAEEKQLDISQQKPHNIPAYIKKAEDDYDKGIHSDNEEYEKLNYGKEEGTTDGAIKGWATRRAGGASPELKDDSEMQGDFTIGNDDQGRSTAMSKGSGYDDWKAKQDDKPQISKEEKEKKRKEWWAKRDAERAGRQQKDEIASTVKPEELRPSGANYRIEASRAMLQDRIESETKFIDEYIKSQKLNEGDEKIQKLRGAVDRVKEKLSNIEKDDDPDLPKIPMGPNTHTSKLAGYIHGFKTKIKVQTAVTSEPATKLLNDRLKSVWNNMPDEHRNLVKKLNIKKSRAGYGRGGKAGSFNRHTGELIINVSTSRSANVVSTMYHEIGHAKWYNMKDNNPEKVEKFISTIKGIGGAPTTYSESYRNYMSTNKRSEDTYRRKMRLRGFPIGKDIEEILDSNRARAKDLYQNESHSELNSYAMGTLPKDRIIVGKETLSKMLGAYKEMYDLE